MHAHYYAIDPCTWLQTFEAAAVSDFVNLNKHAQVPQACWCRPCWALCCTAGEGLDLLVADSWLQQF
jgi:hypothetical protein